MARPRRDLRGSCDAGRRLDWQWLSLALLSNALLSNGMASQGKYWQRRGMAKQRNATQ